MRTQLKKAATTIFLAADRIGVHVQPASYYSSIASRKQLRTSESVWRRPLSPMPFRWDLDEQAEWLTEVTTHVPELDLDTMARLTADVGFRYGPIEGQLLYSVIRTLRPATIVEIGSGSSTVIMSTAVSRNITESAQAGTAIIACDPYAADLVRGLEHVDAKSVGGTAVSAEVAMLRSGDILFIDSTHTVRTGSELSHLYLEVLPNLPSGVIVHIHDVYLPYLYAPDVYTSMFDWQETTLLAGLLTGNAGFRVLAGLAGLHDGRPATLRERFPEYRPRATERGLYADDVASGHFPSSIWLVRS